MTYIPVPNNKRKYPKVPPDVVTEIRDTARQIYELKKKLNSYPYSTHTMHNVITRKGVYK